jgi:hypothetical protein
MATLVLEMIYILHFVYNLWLEDPYHLGDRICFFLQVKMGGEKSTEFGMLERCFLYDWTSNRIQFFLTGPLKHNLSLSFPPAVGERLYSTERYES